MPLSQGTVGQTQKSTDGTSPVTGFRQGNFNEMNVSQLMARYYEQTFRKVGFHTIAAGVTTTVGLATTHTGLALSNAPGNSVNLVVNKVSWSQTVVPTVVEVVGLAVGFNASTAVTHTTPAVIKNSFLGGPAGQALADTSSTLPTAPTYCHFLGDTPVGTTNPNGGWIDIEGGIIIPPGGYLVTATNVASSALAMWFAFHWMEVPI